MNSAIREAAISLQTHLQRHRWFRMVGIGSDSIDSDGDDSTLIVYVGRRGKAVNQVVPNTWMGHRVVVHDMSRPVAY